jgi:hypothetical protein
MRGGALNSAGNSREDLDPNWIELTRNRNGKCVMQIFDGHGVGAGLAGTKGENRLSHMTIDMPLMQIESFSGQITTSYIAYSQTNSLSVHGQVI